MTNHAWQIPMWAIGDVGLAAEIAMAKKVFDDILQVLREADADLAGMQERYHHELYETEADRSAAQETRRNLNRVYEALSGRDLKGDSSDNAE